jgi:hypothetical protein
MIIGVCGLIGSGKGTVSDVLIGMCGFKSLSFADSLKDAVAAVFSWDRQLLEGSTAESREWREQVDPWWSKRLGIPDLTPRLVLQLWGTEVCRTGFHQDIWIASLERKIEEDKNYVIPDTRFPNEINLIKNIGGEIWCVKRGPDPKWFVQYQMGGSPPNHIHSSEWEWARSKFDKTIANDGTLDDLKNRVLSHLS